MRWKRQHLSALRACFHASLAALLVLATQLAPALHFVLVQHSRCSLHGELIHGESHAPRASALEHRVQSTSEDARDVHEHCGIVFLGSVATECEQQAEVDPHVHAGMLIASPTPNSKVGFAAIATLDFAPKSSPPARA